MILLWSYGSLSNIYQEDDGCGCDRMVAWVTFTKKTMDVAVIVWYLE
jgi:hypothetical protein